MTAIKSLWASIQGNPVVMQRANGWLTILWIFMIPVSIVTGWVDSVRYISALSLWALVSGHWSAWQAARVEVKQEEMARPTPVRPRRPSASRVRVRRVAGVRPRSLSPSMSLS